MYPPKVQDEDVRHVIRDLMIDGRLPSGAAVRAEIGKRFKSRGGVARIYRLLAAQRPPQVLDHSTLSPAGVRLLQLENQNLREQLQQAGERERAHQAYWTREVRQLWEHVGALEALVTQAANSGEISAALTQRVQAAELRAGRLDVLIRAFGPAADKVGLSD